MDTYLRLDDTEKQVFQAAISTMGLDEQEEIMEIVTSWQQEALEKVAVNLLREGIAAEVIVRGERCDFVRSDFNSQLES